MNIVIQSIFLFIFFLKICFHEKYFYSSIIIITVGFLNCAKLCESEPNKSESHDRE